VKIGVSKFFIMVTFMAFSENMHVLVAFLKKRFSKKKLVQYLDCASSAVEGLTSRHMLFACLRI